MLASKIEVISGNEIDEVCNQRKYSLVQKTGFWSSFLDVQSKFFNIFLKLIALFILMVQVIILMRLDTKFMLNGVSSQKNVKQF